MHNSDGFKPRVLVIVWGDDDKITHTPLIFKTRYATEQEALAAGLAYAEKWIDDGKPDITGGLA